MNQKTILILEDTPERIDLHAALQDRGFQVVSAPTLEIAYQLVRELGENLDVLVLDMVIEGSDQTGAQFGLAVKRLLESNQPEFLIFSAYGEEIYFQQAIQLEAAAYLRKPAWPEKIARHVRVLALRRALRPWREAITDKIEKIAESSRSKEEAILLFCRTILVPEMEASLGSPFVLLVIQGQSVQTIGSDLAARHSPRAYEVLQAQIDISAAPFIIHPSYVPDTDEISPETREATLELCRDLRGSAFISLYATEDLKLSLGIVQEDREQSKFAENAPELARLLSAFLQPTLVKVLVRITEKFTAIYSKQRALLEAAADFCLYVGQEQLAVMEKLLAKPTASSLEESEEVERLIALGENLRRAGEMLSCLTLPPDASTAAGQTSGSMARLLRDAWLDLQGADLLPVADFLIIEGDCQVTARLDDLRVAVARIFHWFTRRVIETAPNLKPELRVSCRFLAKNGGAESRVVFEDRSRRLPKGIRENLFTPFSDLFPERPGSFGTGAGILGLYLSKVLIEVENGGFLEDRSDELGGEIGHRLVLRLPENDKTAVLAA